MKNGIPYDVAMKLSPTRRLAYTVAFGELEGGRFNWTALKWEDKP